MKKSFLIIVLLIVANITTFAQSTKVEVLYFKANLSCCRAKACNDLEADILGIVKSNYKNGNVVFKQIKIADEANKDLVLKYNAQSQTVILVKSNKNAIVKTEDISQQAKQYQFDKNKEVLESVIKTKINELL